MIRYDENIDDDAPNPSLTLVLNGPQPLFGISDETTLIYGNITSLSYQFAPAKSGVMESNGVSSSVYVFTITRELYRNERSMYTT